MSHFTIKYGSLNTNIDITDVLIKNHMRQNIVFIPRHDIYRGILFTDPLFGTKKYILIYMNNQLVCTLDDMNDVYINYDENIIYANDINSPVTAEIHLLNSNNNLPNNFQEIYPNVFEKLKNRQSTLKLDYGSFNDEFPEQMMAVKYLTGNEKVLEIGGNIGRNSLIISSILNQNGNNNLVTMECEESISKQLIHNRDLNGLSFQVEISALSERNLIQKDNDWETIVSDIVPAGYNKVNTITWDGLLSKYNIEFDTLVLDCEGAFYYMLMDMPQMLTNINLIIMENDYHNYDHKLYVDSILRSSGFTVVYVESGGWGPCFLNFYEVWKK